MPESHLWKVIIHRKAEKVLLKLPKDLLVRIRITITGLSTDPKPAGHKKLVGYENLYRIRVAEWRIIYAIENEKLIVLVLEVSPRGAAYRELK
jgi:mRNA interferase RelE/StbE